MHQKTYWINVCSSSFSQCSEIKARAVNTRFDLHGLCMHCIHSSTVPLERVCVCVFLCVCVFMCVCPTPSQPQSMTGVGSNYFPLLFVLTRQNFFFPHLFYPFYLMRRGKSDPPLSAQALVLRPAFGQ